MSDLRAELLGLYVTEAVELLDRAQAVVEELVRGPGSDLGLADLRRLLHSLKGGAYAAGLAELGDLIHALEGLFPASAAAAPGSLAAARRALSAAGAALQEVARGRELPVSQLALVGDELRRAGAAVGAPGGGGEPASEGQGQRAEPRGAPGASTSEEGEAVGRVNLQQLDRLAGRLVELEGLAVRVHELAEGRSEQRAHSRRLLASAREAAQDLARLRLRPVSELLAQLRATFEDALRRTGKSGRLVLHGEEVLLDRRVSDRLRAAMAHAVTNAVDHGFDAPAAREALGKPTVPTLSLRVEARGIRVSFQVEDDGAGLDVAAVRRRALEQGLAGADVAAADLGGLVFLPGFTTREAPTATSGRGVGLDVVRTTIEAMHGRVRLESRPGAGVRLSIDVPVSLATSRVLVVSRGDRRFGVPLIAAARIVDLLRVEVQRVGGRATILHEAKRVEVADLSSVFGLAARGAPRLAVVVELGDQASALGVDAVLDQVELVVRPVGPPLRALRGVAGLAVHREETLAVVDLRGMCAAPSAAAPAPLPGAAPVTPARAGAGATVLVVDDSITTRTLELDMFTHAGFQVEVATDGVEALARLERGGVELLVTDVEMPRMDGLELVRRARARPELERLPIIVVTSRLDARQPALDVGADACILKRAFDQEVLLDTARRLLGAR